jgi:hypothetical protein
MVPSKGAVLGSYACEETYHPISLYRLPWASTYVVRSEAPLSSGSHGILLAWQGLDDGPQYWRS